MGYASKEALLEYTQEKKLLTVFTPVIGCLGIVMGIFLLDFSGDLLVEIVFPLFLIVVSIWGILDCRKSNSAYKKYFTIAASTGELQRLLNDFADSQSLADDRIRLGDEYIYGKNVGRPIAYTELRKVYPHVITGTTSNSRFLKGVTADGEEHMLCKFIVKKSAKDPHPDESRIFQIMIARNPNIYLGYR